MTKPLAGTVKISGPAIFPFSRCVLFIIFLQTIQAASNSSVSAIGVTSCDEFVTFPAATIMISRLQRKRLRAKKKASGLDECTGTITRV